MKTEYDQLSYGKEDIQLFLKQVQACLQINRFKLSIGERRHENGQFIANYQMTHQRQRHLLSSLRVEEFCYSLPNQNFGHEHEDLMVFMPVRQMRNFKGQKEDVLIYIKLNLISHLKTPMMIVISLHQAHFQPDYCFIEEGGGDGIQNLL